MNTKAFINFFLAAGFFIGQMHSLAQEGPHHTLPDDPAKAWAEVSGVFRIGERPHDWQTNSPTAEQLAEFQKQINQAARSFAQKADEFLERFPTNAHAGQARTAEVHALLQGVVAGDTEAEKKLAAFVSRVVADKSIPEDNRAEVLMYSGNATFMKKAGMRLFTETRGKLNAELDYTTASIEMLRATLKQFPNSGRIYTALLGIAQRSTGARQRELATEIIDAPGAPAGMKTLANHILNETKPYEIGKPVDIHFTGLDGREVDVAKMTGKVVLVDFWATGCVPCVIESPKIKALYDKLHDRGFEIVGISLDEKETALRRFINENKLPWPQHFDGKGFENEFAVRYGIFAIPTMWLVDKRGNLRDIKARSDLEKSVTSLLEEQISASAN